MRGINFFSKKEDTNQLNTTPVESKPDSFRLFYEAKEVPLEVIGKNPSDPSNPSNSLEEEVLRILGNKNFDFSIIEKYCEYEDLEGEKKYKKLVGGNTLDYLDEDGTFDEIKFKENIKTFVLKSFLVWYGGKNIEKLNISITRQDISVTNFDKMPEVDISLCGKSTVNINRDGTEYIKNGEVPKIEIFNLEEFIDKPCSEVIKYVIQTYGKTHRIPDLEDEQYILYLSEDNIPAEMKEEELNYNFIGSTFYHVDGSLNIPSIEFFGEGLLPSLKQVSKTWKTEGQASKQVNETWKKKDRVILLGF